MDELSYRRINMVITFHKEEVEFKLSDKERLTKWLSTIAKSEAKRIVHITYVFCSDEYLLEINKEYLNHDFYTDIITFPYKQGKELESDIFISIDRVRENAELINSSFEKELLRVMSHGILHLMGYKDKTDKEKQVMREKEDWALGLFQKMDT